MGLGNENGVSHQNKRPTNGLHYIAHSKERNLKMSRGITMKADMLPAPKSPAIPNTNSTESLAYSRGCASYSLCLLNQSLNDTNCGFCNSSLASLETIVLTGTPPGSSR